MLNPEPDTNGTVVSWQSKAGQSYFVERASDAGSSFSLLQSNIAGQAGVTSLADTNAIGAGPFLYRVGVPESFGPSCFHVAPRRAWLQELRNNIEVAIRVKAMLPGSIELAR